MKLDDERERPIAGWFEQPNQQRFVAMAHIPDVLDLKIIICQRDCFHDYLLENSWHA
jgi:hypothetical protein